MYVCFRILVNGNGSGGRKGTHAIRNGRGRSLGGHQALIRMHRKLAINAIPSLRPSSLSRSHLSNLRAPQAPSPEWARLLERFAQIEPRPIHLPTLLSYGSPVSLSSVVTSAEYTQGEIACRLARIAQKFDKLPFICGVNPYIAKVHTLYRASFGELASVPTVKNEAENTDFSEHLQRHVNLHVHDIPTLSKGYVGLPCCA